VTIQFYDHQLVAIGSDADLFTALSVALEKLEGQAVKNRGKWRERIRRKDGSSKESASMKKAGDAEASATAKNAAVESGPPVNIFKVNHHDSRKPMTLDEAMLEMEQDRDYVVYRDADKERVSVLVRRRDGHFDLIEG
jgi:putative sigma-54 modulation protein